MPSKQIYEFGEFRIDADERLLLRGGKSISLTPKAFETLLALVENSGHVVKKDDLMKRVWPDAFVEEVNLAQNVSAIRRALNGQGAQYVETVPKLGYRLVVKARVISEPETTEQAPPRPVGSASQPQKALRVTPEALRFSKTAKLVAFGLIALALIGAGVLAWRLRSSPAAAPIHSIVVLPLANLSGDAQQEYFADGITEALTTEVAKVAKAAPLRVISRTTAMRYKNTSRAVPEIGRELKVDAVLEGAVIRSGDHVRITAQLIRAADDEHIWAQAYDRNVADALSVQADIAQDIAREIKLEITPPEYAARARRPQPSAEAQDVYLQARYEWNKRTTEGLHRALELFQQTIDLDPTYAAAWAGLADTEYILVANQNGGTPDGLVRAKAAAQRALALDDGLAEAHASLGILNWSYDRNWLAAEREYKRAIELNPNYATAHQFYGLGLSGVGRFEEAIAEERRAVDLDPLSQVLIDNLGRALYYARRYDEAISVERSAIATEPSYIFHHRIFGLALMAQGHNQEALAALRDRKLADEFLQTTVDLVSV
jgi:TolB-like protein/DNA-binding winged helix-turn-helix (wHTH) protein